MASAQIRVPLRQCPAQCAADHRVECRRFHPFNVHYFQIAEQHQLLAVLLAHVGQRHVTVGRWLQRVNRVRADTDDQARIFRTRP